MDTFSARALSAAGFRHGCIEEKSRMPIPNYHTHTALCGHADGMPADYLEQAVRGGCSALGFSDHCPYPADEYDTWPNMRMHAAEAPQYIAAVRQAAAQAPFPVYAGFECEYAPRYESWYRDTLLGEFGAHYLVLGQHWLPSGRSMTYAPELTEPADIRAYFALTIRAMQTGLFAFLAHPDIIMADGRSWNDELGALFSDLIDAAMGCHMPLEINGYGLVKQAVRSSHGSRQPYPVDQFWQLAADKHAEVICNSDAHTSAAVIENAHRARRYAARFGITPIESLRLAE